jgi:hypothetical protein
MTQSKNRLFPPLRLCVSAFKYILAPRYPLWPLKYLAAKGSSLRLCV